MPCPGASNKQPSFHWENYYLHVEYHTPYSLLLKIETLFPHVSDHMALAVSFCLVLLSPRLLVEIKTTSESPPKFQTRWKTQTNTCPFRKREEERNWWLYLSQNALLLLSQLFKRETGLGRRRLVLQFKLAILPSGPSLKRLRDTTSVFQLVIEVALSYLFIGSIIVVF